MQKVKIKSKNKKLLSPHQQNLIKRILGFEDQHLLFGARLIRDTLIFSKFRLLNICNVIRERRDDSRD